MQRHKCAVKQESSYQAEVRASLHKGEDVGIFPVIFRLISVCPTVGGMMIFRILAEGTSKPGKKETGHSQNQWTLGISFCNSHRNLLKH